MTKPNHLSPEALAFYDQTLPELPLIDFTSQAEVKAVTEAFWPVWQEMSEQIPYAHRFEEKRIDGVAVYEIVPPDLIDESLLIIYLHGGSLVFGHPTIDKNIPVSLGHGSGIRTISIQYPLAPKHNFDVMLTTLLTVLNGIDKHYEIPTRYALVGHSAGACLALSATLSQKEKQLKFADALVMLSPNIDQTYTGDSMSTIAQHEPIPPSVEWVYHTAEAYIGAYDRKHPTVSPLFGNLSDLCPTYIQQAGLDKLVSDATRLSRKLLEAQVPTSLDIWDGLWHGFQMFPLIPESQQANAFTAQWIKQQLM